MKTGEAAKLLGVDTSTIRNWIHHPLLTRFFSESAKNEHGGAQRLLTDADVLVLNTIRSQRVDGVDDWRAISVFLESGQRNQEFPQNAITVDPRTIPLPQAEQSARAMATLAERDGALARIEELTTEVQTLKQRIAEVEKERDTVKENLLREMAELNQQRMREIAELSRQIGRLEGLLEAKNNPKSE